MKLVELEEERDGLLARLEPLRSGAAVPVSKEEREQLGRDEGVWGRYLKRRGAIWKEMYGMVKEIVADQNEDLEEVKVCCWTG